VIWIPITLAAAVFQILRTSRQHELRSALSTRAAGFVRFAYGAPLAVFAATLMFGVLGRPVPSVPGRFWVIVVVAGVSQIVATVALLRAFQLRDFAVGTVYSKSEVLIVSALGAVGVGTPLAGPGWIGAVLVTVGVAWLASTGSLLGLIRRAGDPAAVMGIVAGAGFAGAAIGIRAASRSLVGAPSFDRAVLTLTVLLLAQTAINLAWFAATDPGEIRRTAQAWRTASWVGVFSLLGSLGWAWAFTLESAAKVRTLGQVELIIAFVIARSSLGERHGRDDYAASALVLAGVVLVAVLG
jgi:drug/metabolite transporter (DMT)-like permease